MSTPLICSAAVAMVAGAAVAGSGNMILNGSFEINNGLGTQYNLLNGSFDAAVAHVTAFGSASELDLMDLSNTFGLAPVDGNYKVGMHFSSTLTRDAFSFDLSSSIVAGRTYTVSFWAQTVLDFDPGREPLHIGISNSATDFGTLVYNTGPNSPNSWTYHEHTFVAAVDGAYLTVSSVFGPNPTWIHVDDFRLVPSPGAVSMLALSGLALRRRRR